MVASAASEGPKLRTSRVYCSSSPATKLPTCCFWMNRSALVAGVVVTVAVSLSGLGSRVVVAEMVAVFTTAAV